MLKSKDLYTEEPANLAPYRPELLSILKGEVRAKPASSLVGPEARRLLENPGLFIEKSEEEIEAERRRGDVVRPYWETSLRLSRGKRRELVKLLEARGMICYSCVIQGKIGIFFVWKKSGMARAHH